MSGKKGKVLEKIGSAYLAIPFFIVCVDQLSKAWAGMALRPGESVPLLKGIFHLTLVHNTGAAFGMLRQYPRLFVIISAAAAMFILFFLARKGHTLGATGKTAFCFILGGTMGNLIDRIRAGYVIDFFDLRVWPVFNVADSFITVGAVFLGWTMLRDLKSVKKCTG
jgi:signal peptidase II